MAITRDRLKADTLYFDQSREMYFYTPDGVGGYWYETRAEVIAEHGPGYTLLSVSEILDY